MSVCVRGEWRGVAWRGIMRAEVATLDLRLSGNDPIFTGLGFDKLPSNVAKVRVHTNIWVL